WTVLRRLPIKRRERRHIVPSRMRITKRKQTPFARCLMKKNETVRNEEKYFSWRYRFTNDKNLGENSMAKVVRFHELGGPAHSEPSATATRPWNSYLAISRCMSMRRWAGR